jgi:hypothetical protein
MAQPDDLTKAAGRPLEAISKLFKLEVLAECSATRALRVFIKNFKKNFEKKI